MSGRSRVAMTVVGALAVVLVTSISWYWWPRQVAPGLTPQMVRAIDTSQRHIVLVDGGSRRDAHILWSRYHHRRPLGDPPEEPQLLGVSLAHLTTQSAPGGGTFWVVYSDRVWSPSLGPGGDDRLAREVMFVQPGSLKVAGTLLF